MGKIKIEKLIVKYGDFFALNELDLEIEENKTTCILGVSGCGKTTLLNSLAGLVKYEGSILNTPDKISYVFQDATLIPSLTIKQNIEYVLNDFSKEEKPLIVSDILKKVELLDQQDKYPHSLSGGQRNRAALARAFAYPSSMILMDEPFTGLDISLKSRIIKLFNKLLEQNPKTVVYVTHSIDEALLLADKVCIMDKGKITDCVHIPESKKVREIAKESLSATRRKLLDLLMNM